MPILRIIITILLAMTQLAASKNLERLSHLEKGKIPCQTTSDCEDLKASTCEDNFCQCPVDSCEEASYTLINKIHEDCDDSKKCNIRDTHCLSGKCVCQANLVSSSDGRKCLEAQANLGDSCQDSVQCYTKIASSVCRESKCACQESTHIHPIPMKNNSCWRNVQLGETCQVDGDCSYVDSSHCVKSQCQCRETHVHAASKCLKVARSIDEDCQDRVQCVNGLGKGASCEGGKCHCLETYHYRSESRKCVRDNFLDEVCADHWDCHQPGRGRGRLECVAGACKCMASYEEENGYCVGIITIGENAFHAKSSAVRLAPFMLNVFVFYLFC